MGIREGIESFTNFLNNDLREEYHQERIFNVGDMVEHMDGTIGMIVRRGSNYVTMEGDDGLIKKAWLYDFQGLGFKDVATAKASINKIKNSGKTHAHKIQAAVAMEQRAREMGKTAEAAVYRKYIDQMKEKTKEMNKEDYDDKVEGRVKVNLLDRLEKEMDMNEYNEIGTDEYAQHTMKMTPGQPIQNFRKATDKITDKDLDKFKNEGGTIDKYKKRFKENWKVELDKAVERMKEQL